MIIGHLHVILYSHALIVSTRYQGVRVEGGSNSGTASESDVASAAAFISTTSITIIIQAQASLSSSFSCKGGGCQYYAWTSFNAQFEWSDAEFGNIIPDPLTHGTQIPRKKPPPLTIDRFVAGDFGNMKDALPACMSRRVQYLQYEISPTPFPCTKRPVEIYAQFHLLIDIMFLLRIWYYILCIVGTKRLI